MTAEDEKTTNGPGRARLWNIPNQLTLARIVLSIVFFVLLGLQTHGAFGSSSRTLVLNICVAVFILAVVTDFLDGYLARRWHLISTFGRIADPFADKIIVCGGFVMLTGITPLVEPWFAVVIMFREFLVSGLRSFFESRGVEFGAALSGKLKMICQSITIPVVIFHEANLRGLPESSPLHGVATAFHWLTLGFLTATLLLTIASCLGYLRRAASLTR